MKASFQRIGLFGLFSMLPHVCLGTELQTDDSESTVITGSDGDDVIFGTSGDDLLSGGIGDDWLYGGAGNNVFHFRVGEGVDKIVVFEEDKSTNMIVIQGAEANELILSRSGDDLNIGIENSLSGMIIEDWFRYSFRESLSITAEKKTINENLILSN